MRPSLIAFSAIVPLALAAQEPARSSFYAGGGFEAIGVGAAYERALGLSLQAGYVRQVSRLGIRFGATYFERNRSDRYVVNRSHAMGATFEMTYDLAAGRFRPYVLGGWGVYRLAGEELSSTSRVVDQLSAAMIGGAGFRYRIRGADCFTEFRVHGFTNGNGWGAAIMPVTVGVRF